MSESSFVVEIPIVLIAVLAALSLVNRFFVDPVKHPRIHGFLLSICGLSPGDLNTVARGMAMVIWGAAPPPSAGGASSGGGEAAGANGKAPPMASRTRLEPIAIRVRGNPSGIARALAAAAVVAVLSIALLPGILRDTSTPCHVDDAVTMTQAGPGGDYVAPVNDNGIRCAALVGQGCDWFKANQPAVEADLGEVASCIIAQLFRGTSDPLAIVGACVGATVAAVEQIVSSLIAFYDTPGGSDGGALAEAGTTGASFPMLCRSSPKPKLLATAPDCVSLAQFAGLHVTHARAQAARASGAR